MNHEYRSVIIQDVDDLNESAALPTTLNQQFAVADILGPSMSSISDDRFRFRRGHPVPFDLLSIPLNPAELPSLGHM
jgi:hypothetical protein